MPYLSNIERSAFRRGEHVGYGGGQVWRVRRHGCGGWEAFPREGGGYLRASTLAALSGKLEALTLTLAA